jgi:hypothetical protein
MGGDILDPGDQAAAAAERHRPANQLMVYLDRDDPLVLTRLGAAGLALLLLAGCTQQPQAGSNVTASIGSPIAIRALRGSGAAGHEFAFLQFTNASSKTCSLTGYPGVLLLLGGNPLGKPAVRTGQPIHTVRIPPGGSVSANIVDDSSCNAPISDTVQVIPPNRTDKILLKLALRGCPLTVDPVAPS